MASPWIFCVVRTALRISDWSGSHIYPTLHSPCLTRHRYRRFPVFTGFCFGDYTENPDVTNDLADGSHATIDLIIDPDVFIWSCRLWFFYPSYLAHHSTNREKIIACGAGIQDIRTGAGKIIYPSAVATALYCLVVRFRFRWADLFVATDSS